MESEFSVFWWDVHGEPHEELRGATARAAVERATSLTTRPFATVLGLLARVIITDGGDHCAWEWTKEHGLVFPTKAMLAEARSGT